MCQTHLHFFELASRRHLSHHPQATGMWRLMASDFWLEKCRKYRDGQQVGCNDWVRRV